MGCVCFKSNSETSFANVPMWLDAGPNNPSLHPLDGKGLGLHCWAQPQDYIDMRDKMFLRNIRKTKRRQTMLRSLKYQDSLLHRAALSGYVQSCTYLLRQGSDVHSRDAFGMTPLHQACTNFQIKVVQLLLKSDADPNVQNTIIGVTPLIILLAYNLGQTSIFKHKDINQELRAVKILVEYGANVNLAQQNGMSPLHAACMYGTVQTVSYLIDVGAWINKQDMQESTAIYYVLASSIDLVEKFKLLLNAEVDVNVSSYTCTLLHEAYNRWCHNEYITLEVLQELISRGMSVNVTDIKSKTCLHYKMCGGIRNSNEEAELILLFLNNGFLVNSVDSLFGNTPLYDQFGNYTATKLLLKHGASVSKRNNLGQTVIHFCCLKHKFSGFEECFDMYLQYGGMQWMDSKDNIGCTWLHSAYRIPEYMSIFLNLGCNVNETDIGGATVLHYITTDMNEACKNMLFSESKLHINPQDNHKSTPLHWACFKGKYDLALALIEHGADLTLRDSVGKTACDITIDMNHVHMRGLFPSLSNTEFGPHIRKDLHGNVQTYINICDIVEADMFLHQVLLEHSFKTEMFKDETKNVKEEVEKFVTSLINEVEKVDERFSMKIVPSGSMYESTKCGLPDEFDYMLVLDQFQCDVLEECEKTPGFIQVKHICSCDKKICEFFQEDGTPNKNKIARVFANIVDKALYRVCKHMCYQLSFNPYTSESTKTLSSCFRHGPSINFELRWRGAYLKDMAVSIDLVPMLRISNNWQPREFSIERNPWIDNVKTQCYVALLKEHEHSKVEKDTIETSLCRISWSMTELAIFENITDEERNGYILAKCLNTKQIFQSTVKDVNIDNLWTESPSYILKTAFFHVLEKSRAEKMEGSAIDICKGIYKYIIDRHNANGTVKNYFLPSMDIAHHKACIPRVGLINELINGK